MAEEMQAHLDGLTERNIAAGMSPAEARYAARRAFGGVEQIKERARDERAWVWLEQLARDLGHGVRAVLRTPGFALVSVLTLALGIGVNLAIISLFSSVLLRPLPGVRGAKELVVIGQQQRGNGFGGSSYPQYLAYRAAPSVFRELAAFAETTLDLTADNSTERVVGEFVSENYFRAVGVQMAAGRGFLPSEGEVPGRNAVAVISHRYWQSRWQGEPSVIGRSVLLNGQPFTVVGVAEPDFGALQLPTAHDVWIPLETRQLLFPGETNPFGDMNQAWLRRLVGRLAPGATLAQANELLAARAKALAPPPPEAKSPPVWSHRAIAYSPFPGIGKGGPLLFFAILGAITLLVLAAVAVNAASLFLSRALGRRREVAVRLALGASRSRVVRAMLTEGLVVATAGAAVGLLAAQFAGEWIVGQIPGEHGNRAALQLVFDWRVAAGGVALTLSTVLAIALLPALQGSRVDVLSALKAGEATLTPRRTRLRNGLVVGQVALSMVLLVAAGLMFRSLSVLETDDPADRANAIFMARLEPLAGRGDTLYPQLLERVRALPGVEAVTLASIAPFTDISTGPAKIYGGAIAPADALQSEVNLIAPGYFAMLRLPLNHGRDFGSADVRNAPPVAIVNRALADQLWPGRNPLGEMLEIAAEGERPKQVVGVVENPPASAMLGRAPQPRYFLPWTQQPASAETLMVRTTGDPGALLPDVRAVLRTIDPLVPLFQVTTIRAARARTLWQQRIIGHIAIFCSGSAVLLAMIGLYAALAQNIICRTREIGIRCALGARSRDVLRLVMGHGLKLTFVGLGLGLAGALGIAQLLRSVLVGVGPTDPLTFGASLLALATVAGIACWLPARRATKVDPIVALRCE
jgi:predicted permease